MTNKLRLYDYLNDIHACIKREFSDFVWVKAEIAKLSQSNGNLYLDLVENDEKGVRIACCRAVIWRSNNQKISQKFKESTNSELSAETKILILVKPVFHPDFGLSLQITDIDPLYTIGDMAKKLNDIRMRLAASGSMQRQKQLRDPFDFTRVAVLSPESAAGLGDFQADANRLMSLGICQFDYFTATFQGAQTKESIISALRKIYKENQSVNYDCLVIIRGGGATSDLNYLNEYELAFAITQFNIPVFTGIGHERDRTILDEVAKYEFDTPSKVIHHIIRVICAKVVLLEKSLEQIASFSVSAIANVYSVIHLQHNTNQQMSQAILERSEAAAKSRFQEISQRSDQLIYQIESHTSHAFNSIDRETKKIIHDVEKSCFRQHQTIIQSAGGLITRTNSMLDAEYKKCFNHAGQRIDASKNTVFKLYAPIEFSVTQILENAKRDYQRHAEKISNTVNTSINRIEKDIAVSHATLKVASPKNTLARGFCILRNDQGKAITDKSAIHQDMSLQLELRDGILSVNS
jgi:exodeoxyribonuclease VII large subunit